MQYSTEKTSKTIALILVTMMVVSISALTLPNANAQTTDSFSGNYYTRPWDSQNTAWLEQRLADVSDGPLSAHVRWKAPFALGGVAGFEDSIGQGEHSFDMGDAYAGKWRSASILGGIAYYRFDDPNLSPTLTVAVDLRTGEELWRGNALGGSPFEQTMLTPWGLYSYLWRSTSGGATGTVYSAYDPYTMQWVYNITNIPSGTRSTGYNGQFIIYSLSLSGGYFRYWDQLWMLMQPGVMDTLNRDRVINATEIGLTGDWATPVNIGSAREYRWGDRIIGTYENTASSVNQTVMWAISLKPGEEGTLLYNESVTYQLPPPRDGNNPGTSFTARLFGDTPFDSVHLHWNGDLMYFWAISYGTGEQVWESADFNLTGGLSGLGGEPWQNTYTGTSGTISRQLNYISNTSRYDVLCHSGVGGWLIGYNASGVIWQTFVEDPYAEFKFANGWWESINSAANGKFYFGHYEHSPDNPFPRGGAFLSVNATTGEVLFRINGMFRGSGWGGQAVLESGVILTQDTYNQETWAIGKGPSSTTVMAPDAVVSNGGTAIVRGTVMDISPACSGVQVKLRFPQGVPAVSEQSMSDWMLYVYKQFPRPADTVGVDVVLTVLDSNGQVINTATVTSDIYGQFDYQFVAEDAGAYSVKASFAGSNSYYGSFAVSSPFTVAEAPEPEPEPEPEPVSNVDTYFMAGTVGIIVALIVVGAILVLLLLKRSSKS